MHFISIVIIIIIITFDSSVFHYSYFVSCALVGAISKSDNPANGGTQSFLASDSMDALQEAHQIRITSHGKMRHWVDSALSFLDVRFPQTNARYFSSHCQVSEVEE